MEGREPGPGSAWTCGCRAGWARGTVVGFSRSDCTWGAGVATGGFQAEEWCSQALPFTQGTGQNQGFPALPFSDGCPHCVWRLHTLLAGAENLQMSSTLSLTPCQTCQTFGLFKMCQGSAHFSPPHGFFGPSPTFHLFMLRSPHVLPCTSAPQYLHTAAARTRSLLCSEPSAGCACPSAKGPL